MVWFVFTICVCYKNSKTILESFHAGGPWPPLSEISHLRSCFTWLAEVICREDARGGAGGAYAPPKFWLAMYFEGKIMGKIPKWRFPPKQIVRAPPLSKS